jgi:hypothetical protein
MCSFSLYSGETQTSDRGNAVALLPPPTLTTAPSILSPLLLPPSLSLLPDSTSFSPSAQDQGSRKDPCVLLASELLPSSIPAGPLPISRCWCH